MKRALVTGAAGHIGGWVTRLLLERGVSVTALDRRPVNVEALRHPSHGASLRAITGDVRKPDALKRALDVGPPDAIFHLAMELWTGTESPSELTSIAVDGIDILLDVVASMSPSPRVVYTSSCATLGVSRDPTAPCTERDRAQHASTPYVAAKLAAEARLRERLEEARDVDVVTTLPSMTIGPRDPRGTPSNRRVAAMLKSWWNPLTLAGGLNVVDVRDVALGHLQAFDHGATGARYILGGHNLTFAELTRACQRAAGWRALPPVSLPARLLLPGVRAVQALTTRLGRRPFVTTEQVEQRIGRYAFVDHSLASEQLGYRPRALAETLRAVAER